MADTKISELAEQTVLEATNEFVLADSGETKRITAANLVTGLRPLLGWDAALAAQGLLAETFSRRFATSQAAPTSQTIFASLVTLYAGMTVTNLHCAVGTAAAGTDPTLIKMALCSKAGVVLQQSVNEAADAKWDSKGTKTVALASPYAVTATDGYYVCFLINGTFGSTNLQLVRSLVIDSGSMTAVGSGVVPICSQASQTDFQATSGSQTLSGATGNAVWMGVS